MTEGSITAVNRQRFRPYFDPLIPRPLSRYPANKVSLITAVNRKRWKSSALSNLDPVPSLRRFGGGGGGGGGVEIFRLPCLTTWVRCPACVWDWDWILGSRPNHTGYLGLDPSITWVCPSPGADRCPVLCLGQDDLRLNWVWIVGGPSS